MIVVLLKLNESDKMLLKLADSITKENPQIFYTESKISPEGKNFMLYRPSGNIDINRITILGHGAREKDGTIKWGGYTPEEFVNILSNILHKHNCLNTIKIVDLIGCNIGLKKSNKTSVLDKGARKA